LYTRQKELGHDHVRDDLGGPLSWDLGFLGFGVILVVAWALALLGRSTYAPGCSAWRAGRHPT